MDSPETLARRTFGRRAAFYTHSATHRNPETLARLVALAQPQRSWRAVDIATGTGHTALALAPHVHSVLGLDLTPEMLHEAAVLAAQAACANVSLTVANAHALPLASQSVELVTCRRAAHHFTDLPGALREVGRVLVPGGRLVIDDRSVPDDAGLDALINALDVYHDPSHVREYAPDAWCALLEDAGFAVDTVETFIQHRPLSAYTTDVPPEEVAAIRALLDSTDAAQRAALDLREVDGELHLNHWYVLLAAHNR